MRVTYKTRFPFHFLGVILLLCVCQSTAQAQSSDLDLRMSPAERDSALAAYDNIFPFLGRKVLEKGYRLPAPFGLNLNYFVADQSVEVTNLKVGVNDRPPVPLDDYVVFDDAEAFAQTVNLRADLWVLPFLNIYGILGYADARTTVKLAEPITLEAEANMAGPSYGFGFDVAFGLMGNWVAFDQNWVWSDFDIMSEPVRSTVSGIRVGKNHRWFSDKSVTVWVGAMRVGIARATSGSVVLGDIIDLPADAEDRLGDWLSDLPASVETRMREILAGGESTVIHYSLDKKPSTPWTMLVGGQIELSRRWQVRTEFNFLGDRRSMLLNLVYRLDL